MEDFFIYFWWLIIPFAFAGIGFFVGADEGMSACIGAVIGILLTLIVALIGPLLHFVIAYHMTGSSYSPDESVAIIMGCGAIAGVLLIAAIVYAIKDHL